MGYRERECERVVNETMGFLVSDNWRNADGGWGVMPGRTSDVWSTAELIELLITTSDTIGLSIPKVQLPSVIEAATNFLIVKQNGDGGWGFEPGTSDATGTEL